MRSRDEAELVLFPVLINVYAEERPVGVGRLEPGAAAVHGADFPARPVEDFPGVRGDRFLVSRRVHG